MAVREAFESDKQNTELFLAAPNHPLATILHTFRFDVVLQFPDVPISIGNLLYPHLLYTAPELKVEYSVAKGCLAGEAVQCSSLAMKRES